MAKHHGPRLFKLSSTCTCGRVERRRIFEWEVIRYEDEDPELPTDTVQCKCGRLYVVRARHYQEATFDERATSRILTGLGDFR